jgi:hypothetical protein
MIDVSIVIAAIFIAVILFAEWMPNHEEDKRERTGK